MAVWKLKGCPRCGGDVYLDSDLNGWYEQCLQCSQRHELKDIRQFQEPGMPTRELATSGRKGR